MVSYGKWKHVGGPDLGEGGFYWREDGTERSVFYVAVKPRRRAQRPENVHVVVLGTVRLTTASDGDRTRTTIMESGAVEKAMKKNGIDAERSIRVQIGAELVGGPPKGRRQGKTPDVILRKGADLRTFVEATYLRGLKRRLTRPEDRP